MSKPYATLPCKPNYELVRQTNGGRMKVVMTGPPRTTVRALVTTEEARVIYQIAADLGYYTSRPLRGMPSVARLIRAIAQGELLVIPYDRVVNVEGLYAITEEIPP